MAETKIQWTERTWNPVRGCSDQLYSGVQVGQWWDAQQQRIAELERLRDRLLNACKLALGAFEHNWNIDWSEIERSILAGDADVKGTPGAEKNQGGAMAPAEVKQVREALEEAARSGRCPTCDAHESTAHETDCPIRAALALRAGAAKLDPQPSPAASGVVLRAGWLKRQIDRTDADVAQWPQWMKDAIGCTDPDPRDQRIAELGREVKRLTERNSSLTEQLRDELVENQQRGEKIRDLKFELAGAQNAYRQIREAMALVVAERDAAREALREAVEALRHLRLRESRAVNPFGHACQWCVSCVQRVNREAAAIIARFDGGKDA